MKVLFAVNKEEISSQIIKKYQKEYKEIISYKNVYYFNAIIKELQRDKSYDRIVISEDLEPFADNNYDRIDKFIFEKLDSISDEATGNDGADIPIILICTERRSKSDAILVKFFGIGIYNALLGSDRSIANLCSLISKPRNKKDAKIYYKIESNDVNYQTEDENSVSEAEIQSIINYYKKLGKNEEKFSESFDKIAMQYNDIQLKTIIKFLPLNVKAVLEAESPKYQSIMTFSGETSARKKQIKIKEDGIKMGLLKNNKESKMTKPVIVPTAVNTNAVRKISKKVEEPKAPLVEESPIEEFEDLTYQEQPLDMNEFEDINDNINDNVTENINENNDYFEDVVEDTVEEEPTIEQEPEPIVEEVRRGRGRPKKIVPPTEESEAISTPKRGRGRPKKSDVEDSVLPGLFDDEPMEETKQNDTLEKPKSGKQSADMLPGFEDVGSQNYDESEPQEIFDDFGGDDDFLPGFDDFDAGELDFNDQPITPINNKIPSPGMNKRPEINTGYNPNQRVADNNSRNIYQDNNEVINYNNYGNNNMSNMGGAAGNILKDKKIVTFVGTTKNGTSFLVNNTAKCLSSMGIKTAILDLTQNRNSYYIFTNNKDDLRNIAFESIKRLNSGIIKGIDVDKNLSVFTGLPGDNIDLSDAKSIISTLKQKFSVVLIDCDFSTPLEFFSESQEIYIVQTYDILTIQPMTAFLRELKAKNVLDVNKLRIVINKEIKVRGLSAKTLIGGLAFYNDPAMSFMTELFNKDTIKYCTIPLEYEVYSKYLESMVDCEINLNGYSKNFMMKLKELAGMVYPLLNNTFRSAGNYTNDKFSSDINRTLEQMKNKY